MKKNQPGTQETLERLSDVPEFYNAKAMLLIVEKENGDVVMAKRGDLINVLGLSKYGTEAFEHLAQNMFHRDGVQHVKQKAKKKK